MDELEKIPGTEPPEKQTESAAPVEPGHEVDSPAEFIGSHEVIWVRPRKLDASENDALRKQNFRHTLFQLLGFTLAAFTLAVWVFVRAAPRLESSLSGPQDVARAQLEALDRGELRPAYDMLSARYRQQVSFDLWRHLIMTHWRMFHAEVLHSEELAETGAKATLEIDVRGADEKDYRARFTMIRMGGQWWIDDMHWAEEPDTRDLLQT